MANKFKMADSIHGHQIRKLNCSILRHTIYFLFQCSLTIQFKDIVFYVLNFVILWLGLSRSQTQALKYNVLASQPLVFLKNEQFWWSYFDITPPVFIQLGQSFFFKFLFKKPLRIIANRTHFLNIDIWSKLPNTENIQANHNLL